MTTCSWPLGNGNNIQFNVYDENKNWKQIGGLYIFSYLVNGYWRALYVGQTDDFSSRLPSHERLSEAVNKGATHIHAAVMPTGSDRNKYEKLLIENLQPPMNSQHR